MRAGRQFSGKYSKEQQREAGEECAGSGKSVWRWPLPRELQIQQPLISHLSGCRAAPCTILKANVSKEEPMESPIAGALEALQEMHSVDYAVYTDGSAQGSMRDGGAGVMVMRNEELVNEWSVSAGTVTSSLVAESIAMMEATEWQVGRDDWRTTTVISDSRSLTEAQSRGTNRGKLREILTGCGDRKKWAEG